jgi:hypothetical protein
MSTENEFRIRLSANDTQSSITFSFITAIFLPLGVLYFYYSRNLSFTSLVIISIFGLPVCGFLILQSVRRKVVYLEQERIIIKGFLNCIEITVNDIVKIRRIKTNPRSIRTDIVISYQINGKIKKFWFLENIAGKNTIDAHKLLNETIAKYKST